MDSGGYGTAAAVYLVLLDHFCTDREGNPDWHAFSKLFAESEKTTFSKDADQKERFRVFAGVCERVFGKRAKQVLQAIRIPTD